MFVPFLIMLREGLEAALIVSLIAGYLKKIGRYQWLKMVWSGVIAASLLCLVLGLAINATAAEFPQKKQELFEGIVAIVAVIILTNMVLWMRKMSLSVKNKFEMAVDQALTQSSSQSWALAGIVFFAVAREGLEAVFFLLATFSQDVNIASPIGAVFGLVCAIVLGILMYWTGIRLPLAAFFKWTSVLILFVTAGLAASAIRSFHEAGLWNRYQSIAFDWSSVLSTHTLIGTLLEGLFGYQETPTVSEVTVYVCYLVVALILFFLPSRQERL